MSDHEDRVLGGSGNCEEDDYNWEPQAWNLFITNLANASSKHSEDSEVGSDGKEKVGSGDGDGLGLVIGTAAAAEGGEGGGGGGKGKGSSSGGRVVKRVREEDRRAHIITERERRKRMRDMFDQLHCLLPHLPPKTDKATIVDETARYIKTLEKILHDLQTQNDNINHNHTSSLPPTPSSLPSPFSSSSTITNNNDIKPPLNLGINTHRFIGSASSSPTSSSFALREEGLIKSATGSTTSSPRDHHPIIIPSPVFRTWTSPNIVLNTCGDDAQIVICSPRKPGLLTSIVFLLDKFKIEVDSALVSSDDDNRSLYCMIQARLGRGALNHQSAELVYKQAATEITCLL